MRLCQKETARALWQTDGIISIDVLHMTREG